MSYKNILFALDGASVTDNEADTVAGVWDKHNDMGSRWIFYPVPFVVKGGRITDRSRIIDIPDVPGVEHLKCRTVKSARQWVVKNADYLVRMMQ